MSIDGEDAKHFMGHSTGYRIRSLESTRSAATVQGHKVRLVESTHKHYSNGAIQDKEVKGKSGQQDTFKKPFR